MNGSNQNKVIWITGASSCIGEALSLLYADLGHRLNLSARNEKKLNQVRSACIHPENVKILVLDLAHPEVMTQKVEAALACFGDVDVLVNNGGISQRSLALETHIQVDRQPMEINYFGTISLSKALLPQFIQRKKGHIAVVSSYLKRFLPGLFSRLIRKVKVR